MKRHRKNKSDKVENSGDETQRNAKETIDGFRKTGKGVANWKEKES